MSYSIGEKIIYGESGVCIIDEIGPLDMMGAPKDKLYYHMHPLIGSGKFFTPVDGNAFMRPVMTKSEAEKLILSIPEIEPAICNDSRFNHVDAFYKELFRQHTPEALVSVIKGLKIRTAEKKTRSSRADATLKRAREVLYGELSVALGMEYSEVNEYINEKIG